MNKQRKFFPSHVTTLKATSIVLCLVLIAGLAIYAANPAYSQTNAPGGISTDLHLWMKADAGHSGTNSGDTIGSWTSQSPGSIFTATDAADPEEYITDAINFNPAIRFDESAGEGIVAFMALNSMFCL